MDELAEIERSIEIAAPPDEIWERIIDGDLAEEWLGVRVEPRPGGKVSAAGRDLIGTVEEVVPGESITWSWREPHGDPSQVVIDIEPTPAGTRVNITERLLRYRITGMPPVCMTAAA